jgi:hypothetical protein
MPVVEFLKKNPGQFDFNAEEVADRATVVRDDAWPDGVVFEMDCHLKPEYGLVKRIDSRLRFGFRKETNELLQIAVVGVPEVACDMDVLLCEEIAFTCERMPDSRIVCTELSSNATIDVSSPDEAEAFGRKVPYDWNTHELWEQFETGGLDVSDQINSAINDALADCASYAGKLARDSWFDLMNEEAAASN